MKTNNNSKKKFAYKDNNKVMKTLEKGLKKKEKDTEFIDVTKELFEKGYSMEEVSSILDIPYSFILWKKDFFKSFFIEMVFVYIY